MTEFDKNKLRQLDLTVLLIFLGLMRHRKAATVADEIGLTQSSISHALRRLRGVFEDQLFLRKPYGLEPTAVASEIEPLIRDAVEALNSAFSGSAGFDPSTSEATLRIAALDLELGTILPSFIKKLTVLAPGMRVSTLSLARKEALQALTEGAVDLAIGYFWDIGPKFISQMLYEESFRVTARSDHPLMASAMTTEAYAGARHIVVSTKGDLVGVVDESLAELGLTRNVAVSVPLFFPALAIAAQTDFVATLPACLVKEYAGNFGLSWQEPPLNIRPFPIMAVRHLRDEKNPMHLWAIELLAGKTD